MLRALIAKALDAGLEPGDLVPREVHADRAQLLHHAVVAPGRVGLLLERGELTADLAQQVVEPEQASLGGFEPALGALAPLAELQDAGRFLDDRPPVLGARVQHGVELALPDDHVLLASDARVGEELLDVEQAARRVVDPVLGVTRRGTAFA